MLDSGGVVLDLDLDRVGDVDMAARALTRRAQEGLQIAAHDNGYRYSKTLASRAAS